MKIGKYLTTDDITKSQTAIRKNIDNSLTAEQQESARYLIEKVYDVVKDKFPEAFVSSFFRCDKLNLAIGGAKGSQHAKGEAVDIDSASHNKQIYEFIRDHLDYDQLIAEFGNDANPDWVHVSIKKTGNRREKLRAKKNSAGKTFYEKL